jgi:nitrate reductase (NAD(P)H)
LIIVNNEVYDCTEYLELHPGGMDSIMINAGGDATEDFTAIHSTKATKMLKRYYIGDLDTSSVNKKSAEVQEELLDDQGRKLFLNPKYKTKLTLQNKIVLSRDSYLLDFALPTPDHVLGLPTGKHIFVSAIIHGETILRRYTPITSNHDVGCVKFVIKAYRSCERFPQGGKMSQYLDNLKVGDTLDCRGPVGEFEYFGNGRFTIDHESHQAKQFNFVAGGTGITPCMQVVSEILRHSDDLTQVSLIFAARVEGDLLLKSTLDEWAVTYPHKFKVHYILSDTTPSDWKYAKGYVDYDLFQTHFYPASDDCYTLMCGPPIMIQKGCLPPLDRLGHRRDRQFAF